MTLVCCIDQLFSCAVRMDCSIIRAAIVGHTDIVQYLVEETSAQVNATDRVSLVATTL